MTNNFYTLGGGLMRVEMRWAWVLGLIGLVGCGGEPAPEPAGEVAPTLADIQGQLLTPSCSFSSCHGGANPKRGLDLSNADASMAGLVGIAGEVPGSVRVIPGDPDGSLLVQVLEGQVGDVRQMPPSFPVSVDVMTSVREWILAGAPRGQGQGALPQAEGDDLFPEGAPRPEDLPPPAEGEGFQMGIDTIAPAGKEIWKCMVADLPGESAFVSVNRVESLQTLGVHHMDVMALGLLGLPIEPGMYDCDDLYSAHQEMMEDGIFLFATQNERETLQLPEGVAAFLPGNMRVMVEIHYVNPTPKDVAVWSRINALTMPNDQVQERIWGSAVRDVDINLTAGVRDHYEWTRCVMTHDIDVILLSSHTHQLAARVDIFAFDGVQRGELLYVNEDWHSPQLQMYEVPMHIPAGQGFEFRCLYNNPTEKDVHWGFAADDEMCQIAFVHTPFLPNASCTQVESGAGPSDD